MNKQILMNGHHQEEQRDFLAEAARLALQLDPLAWEFDLSDRGSRAPIACPPGDLNSAYHSVTTTSDYRFPHPQVREVANATQWSQQPLLPYHDTAPHQLNASGPIRGPSNPRLDAVPQMLGYPSIQHSLTSPVEGVARTTPGFNILPQDGPWNAAQTEGVSWQKSNLGSSHPIMSVSDQQQECILLQSEVSRLRREKEASEDHARMLEQALMNAAKDIQRDAPADFIPSQGWMTFDPKASVILTTIFKPPKRISAEDAASIPLQEYAMLWRSYMVAVRECMKDLEGANKANDKLEALLAERHGFLSWVAANNPSICHCLLTMDMGCDSPRQVSSELTPEQKEKILDKINLSDDQQLYLLEARNEYLRTLGYHTTALKMLQAKLAALEAAPAESVRNSNLLSWLSTARSLQETVEDLHVDNMMFHYKMYKMKRGITSYQAAVLMIESYPCLPDVVGLLSELATARNAPSAAELIRLGSDQFNSRTDHDEVKFVREPHPPTNDKIGKLTVMLLKWEAMQDSQAGHDDA